LDPALNIRVSWFNPTPGRQFLPLYQYLIRAAGAAKNLSYKEIAMTAVGQRVVDDRVLPAPFGRAITMQSGGRRSRSAIPKAYEPKPRKHSPNEVPDLLQRCRSQSQKDVWFAMSTLRRRTLVSRHY
jgi:hypothetical protein